MGQGQAAELERTPLYKLHEELQARMVPFAGYEMPVQYPSGIRAEHEHTRTRAGLFDISHMGQIGITGRDTANVLEKLVPGDIQGLKPNRQRYSVLTNDKGGILDDLMITRLQDSYFLVVNAACKEKDYAYLKKNLEPDNNTELLTDRALLALQGPAAAGVLAKFAPGIIDLHFLEAGRFDLAGSESLVHRCGYTGEDGFEISIAADAAEELARVLLREPDVMPVGLGARDSLRLEAGLCLYGHDLDETISPVEADLRWVVAAKYHRENTVQAHFPGAAIILDQLSNGVARIRRGFRPQGKVPVREGALIVDRDGKKAGIITSGGYGQTVGAPIAMGYLDTTGLDNSQYFVKIRNNTFELSCVELPFVKHRYSKN